MRVEPLLEPCDLIPTLDFLFYYFLVQFPLPPFSAMPSGEQAEPLSLSGGWHEGIVVSAQLPVPGVFPYAPPAPPSGLSPRGRPRLSQADRRESSRCQKLGGSPTRWNRPTKIPFPGLFFFSRSLDANHSGGKGVGQRDWTMVPPRAGRRHGRRGVGVGGERGKKIIIKSDGGTAWTGGRGTKAYGFGKGSRQI